MKKLILTFLAIAGVASASAQSYVAREGEVKFKMLQTTASQEIHEMRSTPFTKHV